jgi:hypothetical protein
MIAQPPPENTALFSRRAAAAFGVAMILGFALLIATVGFDRGRRTDLEKIVERTAVGDRNYFALPDPGAKIAVPSIMYQGRELRIADKVEIRDVRLLRVAPDDSGKYTLYRARDKDLKDEEDQPLGDTLLLKLEPDQYVKVAAADAVK